MDLVRYDLSRNPASYNCLEYFVAAATRGAKRVYIDVTRGFINKYPTDTSTERLLHIVIPSCALAGMGWEFGVLGEDAEYHMNSVITAYHERGYLAKLRSVKPPGNVRYTVTIRDYERVPERNSNREAWERFANDIGAMFIDDWYKAPLGLHERMALYAGAEMNFHVANGPAALCYLSEAPCLVFMKGVNRQYHSKNWPIGTRLPWSNDRQHFVWQTEDTYNNIWRSWNEIRMREAA